jgi:rhodanese-related sulfurtransferase/CBS domain-containing protein
MAPIQIDRREVQRLLQKGAHLVEVLPAREYEEEHLVGAISIPLKRLTSEIARRLDGNQPIIVYCWDYQCDLSPRAAWRLESLGYGAVHDYVAGKADWLAAGLPTEGRLASVPRAGVHARDDVPVCALQEKVSWVADRMRATDFDEAVVLGDERIVLGILSAEAIADGTEDVVEAVMTPGPSTFRPSITLEEMTGYMDKKGMLSAIITTNDGAFVGVLSRSDAEHALGAGNEERMYQSAGTSIYRPTKSDN